MEKTKTKSIWDGLNGLLEQLLSLLVIFLLLATTVIWSGRLFGHDIGTARATEQKAGAELKAPAAAELEQLGLSNAALSPRDSASWQVTDAAGNAAGVLISSTPYARTVRGFAGPTPLYIYVDAAGNIRAIVPTENAESPDFFNRAAAEVLPRWIGTQAEAAQEVKADAVSGATFSSTALIQTIQATLAGYHSTADRAQGAPVIGWTRTAAVLAVMLLGIVAAWRYRGVKWLRLTVLVLNVGVTGFWCGQFLSVSLLRGWISNGLDPLAYLPTLVMLAVALLMPLVGRKRHYCTWVCPYGSLQDLAARLPLPKIHCPAPVYRWMGRIRMGVLLLLLLALWTGIGAAVIDYEPFTAFLVQTAPPAVMILAGTFVVAGCFVPHLWCRSVCPMGMLLELSESGNAPRRSPRPKK